jgi:SET domain-containing protein 6
MARSASPRTQRISLREFAWGYAASASRTFGLRIEGNTDTGMVPLAEMFNHSPDPNCDWSGNHTRTFEIRAQQDIPAGTPLTVTYGKVPNKRLLAQYGFCIEDNRHDVATLRLRVETGHWLHDVARELTGGWSLQECEIGADPTAPNSQQLLSLLRLIALPDRAAVAAHAALRPGAFTRVPVLDLATERVALDRLVQASEQALNAFPSGSDEDDDALLASGRLTPNRRNALIVRRGEKRLLRCTMAYARTALSALSLPDPERRASLQCHADEGGPWANYFGQVIECLDRAREPAMA